MLNQLLIVGRIDNIEKDGDKCMLNLKVPRNFKNESGEYEEDFLSIQLFKNISDTVNDYCKSGDIVGVKGRVQSSNILIAEKVTFLSSKKDS